MPAGAERRLADRLCRPVGATDQFDHDIGVGAARHGDGVVVPAVTVEGHAPVPAALARRDVDDLDPAPGPERKQVRLALDEPHQTRADRAEAGNSKPERRHRPAAATGRPASPAKASAAARNCLTPRAA